jgi:hypothetical protein
MNMFSRISEFTELATKRLRVRSALNPILWLCAIAMPICFIAAYAFRGLPGISATLICLGGLPLVVACLAFVGFAIFKPDKLQSEEYQIKHESLQLIQQKAGRLTVSRTSLTAIANPQHPLLPPGDRSDA